MSNNHEEMSIYLTDNQTVSNLIQQERVLVKKPEGEKKQRIQDGFSNCKKRKFQMHAKVKGGLNGK